MAKIIKIASTTTPRNANPFRTSRSVATNPFKYSNFEGNTLQFADVFEGFEPKNISKLKMIAASVTGTMNKIKSGFEPIVNFVNRVRGGISSAWDYAKNTSVTDLPGMRTFSRVMNTPVTDLPGIKTINRVMNTPIEINLLSGITDSLSGIKTGISGRISSINDNVTTFGKELSDKWTALVSKIQGSRISSDLTVNELEELWKKEIELEVGGAV